MIEITPATVTIDGTTYTAELATVESTSLGYVSHGTFTALVCFEWSGGGQCNEARGLDEYNKATEKRDGTAFGLDHIMRIMKAFGVSTWEQIKGKRAYLLKSTRYGPIDGIMNVDDSSKYMIFREHARRFFPNA